MSFKPQVGYKLSERLTSGLGVKYYYFLNDNPFGDNIHLNDIGISAFTRFRITEAFFLHAEYSHLSFDSDYGRFNGFSRYGFDGSSRKSFTYPVFGAGYASGFGDWKSSYQILFIGDENVRGIGQYPVEFWFGFSKNF